MNVTEQLSPSFRYVHVRTLLFGTACRNVDHSNGISPCERRPVVSLAGECKSSVVGDGNIRHIHPIDLNDQVASIINAKRCYIDIPVPTVRAMELRFTVSFLIFVCTVISFPSAAALRLRTWGATTMLIDSASAATPTETATSAISSIPAIVLPFILACFTSV